MKIARSFTLSEKAILQLKNQSKETGMSMSSVIESLISENSYSIGKRVKDAKNLLDYLSKDKITKDDDLDFPEGF